MESGKSGALGGNGSYKHIFLKKGRRGRKKGRLKMDQGTVQ